MSQGLLEEIYSTLKEQTAVLESINSALRDGKPVPGEAKRSNPTREAAKPAAEKPKPATTSRKGGSPMFDDDDDPAPSDGADEVDWVGLATKVARQKVAEGIDRAKIKGLIADEGIETLAQADPGQAKKLHDAIKALSKDDEEGF